MCTVVVTVGTPGEPAHVLALRDEFADRGFDDPDTWWPDQPGVVGGRDRTAGGSWCVTDIAQGTTALVLNRTERLTGSPSRGLLPLAAVAHGTAWTEAVDHRQMAGFNLVLAGPGGATVWSWDARELRRVDLTAGTHVVTSNGVDSGDAKTARFAPWFAASPVADWSRIVAGCVPSDADGALVVRREYDGRRFGTVFGQLIEARAGRVVVRSSRTPWESAEWQARTWRVGGPRPSPRPVVTPT